MDSHLTTEILRGLEISHPTAFERGRRDALRACKTGPDTYQPPYPFCAEYDQGWAQGCDDHDRAEGAYLP